MAATRGGAHRLELCAGLHEGGTTPSAGMIAAVRSATNLALHVLVRPRAGGFVYSDAEFEVMRADVEAAKSFGADGIVSGVLLADGNIDEARTRLLVLAASPLPFIFHRAFDVTPDLELALETLVRCGVRAVLTSGGAGSASEGVSGLKSLAERAGGRIAIIAGGGVREGNVSRILRESGVREIHTRPTLVRHGPGGARPLALRRDLPADEWSWDETDEERVRAIVRGRGDVGTS